VPASRHFIVRVIGWMSGAIVVLVSVALPVIFFAIGWEAENIALRTEVTFYGRALTAIVNGNPNMWRYEETRLKGLLSTHVAGQPEENRRILELDGAVITSSGGDLPWPTMVRRQHIMDAGVRVGTLEIRRSLRLLMARTGILALAGAVLGGALFFLLRVYPMSALRNALDLLSREKERAHVTLHSIGDGVIATDSEGRVVLLNRVAEDLTGWPQAEASGQSVGEIYRQEGGELVARDGSRRLVEASRSPILDEDGRSFGDVLVFRDVTDKARAAAEMLKAQKLESLGILAGGIAHEIRNPLSAVNISVATIESVCGQSEGLEPDAREKIRLVAEQAKSAAAKMTTVIQRVMDFSKPTPPHMEMVNLNEAVEEALRLSSSTLRRGGIAVWRNLAPDLPQCRADLRLLEQVLVNLITNAYQAMEKMGGAKELEISSAVQDRVIVIRVADSGPGVPPALRGRIFDPFFTTRRDGSGIGLSFSHRIVLDHGGTLGVDTSKWGGAEFRIEIPRTRKGPAA